MVTPTISFLIPTYNAIEYIQQCLDAVEKLDYPKNKIQIVVADGGSTDGTLEILTRYDVRIVRNDKRTAEYGKKIAFDNSTGSIVVLLDSDNIIASTDWLKKLLKPFERKEVIGVESEYLFANDFKTINRYATCLIIVDPVARLLATRPSRVERTKLYNVKYFKKGSTIVSGANGFLWRRSIVEEYLPNLLEFNETLLLSRISADNAVYIGSVTGIGIYHYYTASVRGYWDKRTKIARKHLERSKNTTTWVKLRGKARMFGAIVYSVTIVGPTIEAFYNVAKGKDAAWLWHPFVSLLTIINYSKVYMESLHEN